MSEAIHKTRIHKIRFKRRTWSRCAQAFDIKTSQLLRAVAKGAGK